ncbi:MAG: ribonuclease HII [Bacillota bacterium]|jgi:ribonuclease HII
MKWHKLSCNQIKDLMFNGDGFTEVDIEELRKDKRVLVGYLIKQWERWQLEKKRVSSLYSFERELYRKGIQAVAGIDEAGRGPLAGPVVAGTVILPPECFISGINDSKQLSSNKRYLLEKEIKEKSLCWAVGAVGSHDIDKINIYRATCLAMIRALKKMPLKPQHLLIDAIMLKDVDIPQTTIIKGDKKSASIAAASILAKCHRDRLMEFYDTRFPQYGFARHKGYPTREHIDVIKKYGETSIHRHTFRSNK